MATEGYVRWTVATMVESTATAAAATATGAAASVVVVVGLGGHVRCGGVYRGGGGGRVVVVVVVVGYDARELDSKRSSLVGDRVAAGSDGRGLGRREVGLVGRRGGGRDSCVGDGGIGGNSRNSGSGGGSDGGSDGGGGGSQVGCGGGDVGDGRAVAAVVKSAVPAGVSSIADEPVWRATV